MLRNASERLTGPYEEAQNPGQALNIQRAMTGPCLKCSGLSFSPVKFMSGFCYNTQSHSQGLVNSGRTVHCLPTEVSSLHAL